MENLFCFNISDIVFIISLLLIYYTGKILFKKKKVFVVLKKHFPVTVIKTKVGKLNKKQCSTRFLELNLSDDTEIYLKSDIKGNIEYRGKNKEYRTYSIDLPLIKEL